MKKYLLACALVLLWMISPAAAQSVFNSAAIPTQVSPAAVAITSTGLTTLYTGASHGSVCFGGTLNWNDESATHLLAFQLTLSSIVAIYASFTTTNAGSAGALNTPLNIMSSSFLNAGAGPIFPINYNGNQAFMLKSGDTWKVNVSTAITNGDAIFIIVQCADFQ